tara:strand:+ start:36 stop:779 length:744 start_codon:yes stop_codon:yes gene_type:complete
MKNKNIIITGASQGIGESITKKFFNKNSNVFLISRNKNKLETIKKQLSKNKINSQIIDYYTANVQNFNDISDIVKAVINKYKKIDVLINNAGINDDNLIVKMKEDQWNRVIDTNLTGTYNCCKAVSKYMIKQKFGKIINISSVIGEIGNKGQVNYAASKAGIVGLTKSLSKELGSRNINVNAINPGFIKTEMTEKLKKDKNLEFLNKIPLNRFGNVEDVSNLVYFLASKDSDYITGQTINIDGGMVV